MTKKGLLAGCVLALAIGCGPGNNGENNGNADTNNDTSENASTNSDTNNDDNSQNVSTNNDDNSQNVSTNNDTTSNNTTNNSTNNDTTSTNNTTNNSTNNSTNNNTNNQNPWDLMGECAELEWDSDGDGTIDISQLQEKDADGNNTTLVNDFGNDGSVEQVFYSTFDAEGNELTRDGDRDADGTVDRMSVWEYTDDGQVESLTVTENGMEVYTIAATYNADGNLLTWERDGEFGQGGTIAVAADGTPDFTDTRTYNGELLETLRLDTDGDGDNEMTYDATFDANGNPTEIQWDGVYDFENDTLLDEADGTANVIQTRTYNADNQVTRLEVDGGSVIGQSDGTVDYIEQNITYDSNGNRTSFELDGRQGVFGEIQTTADGTFDAATQTWDADGNQTGFTFDEGNDGSDEVALTRTFDADGQVLTARRDGVIDNTNAILSAMDGTDDWLLDRTWMALEMPLTYELDADGDGSLDLEATWSYDGNGNLTEFMLDGEMDGVEVVESADGTPDDLQTVTWDDMNRRTSYERSVDGSLTASATWTYDDCANF